MGAPSQVRAKLCVVAASLVLGAVAGSPGGSRAQDGQASCVDPSAYARSVVSVSRYFATPRRIGDADVIGERATAWFYTSSRLLVTAAHFAHGLPPRAWTDVELRQTTLDGKPDRTVRAQIRVAVQGRITLGHGGGQGADLAEDVAILELRSPFPNAQVLDVGQDRPPDDASILVLGYPGGKLQATHGNLRAPESLADQYAGLTLLEIQGANRLLFDGGSSGAPVLDCANGQVVGVLNAVLTMAPLPLPTAEPSGPSRPVPTAWGRPTNTAVPAAALAPIRNCIL